MKFSWGKTATKAGKETLAVSAASAVVIQVILENVFGVDIPKEDIVKVSGAIGVVSGVVRGAMNWWKNRKRQI